MKRKLLAIIPLIVLAIVFSAFAADLEIRGKTELSVPVGNGTVTEQYTLYNGSSAVSSSQVTWRVSVLGGNYLEWDVENPEEFEGFDAVKGVSISGGKLTVTSEAEKGEFYVIASYNGTVKTLKVRLGDEVSVGFSSDGSTTVIYKKSNGRVTFSGELSGTVLAARYNANGKLMGLKQITSISDEVAFAGADTIKLFMMENGKPLCEHAEIKR